MQNDRTPKHSVRAALNYSTDMGRRPQIINSDYSKNDLYLVPFEMSIAADDVLSATPNLSSEGFTCVRHEVDINDLETSQEVAARYRADMGIFMRELTGADEIVMLPINVIRRQDPPPSGEIEHAPPVDFVHTDYTVKGSLQAIEAPELFNIPSEPRIRRRAVYNMWKLLSPGPTNRPLAFCDSRSIQQKDILPGDSVFPPLNGFSFETCFLRYNEKHRWHYYPQLTTNHLLVFKQSDTDSDFPRLVPHSAFIDPTCSPAASRVSLETRCLAVWLN